MSQKFITNTTSFILSSDESLNKPPLSSSQSTGSSGSNDNMTTTSDSVQNNNQYFVSLDSVSNNMVHNQQKRIHPSVLPPPPPPSYSLPQVEIYGTSNGTIDTNIRTNTITADANSTTQASNNNINQHTYGHINLNLSQCNGNSGNSLIYSSNYNQDKLQQSPNTEFNPKTKSNFNQEQLYQTYSSGNNSTCNPTTIAENNKSSSPSINCQTINGSSNNSDTTYGLVKHASTYSPKSNKSVQTFYKKQVNTGHQRTSINSNLDLHIANHMMPINVKGMLLHGVSGNEVIRNWLSSIECEEYLKNFIDNGYDMPLITRMTPQDLTAIGCKSPTLRKKLLIEIKKLNLDDDIPECRPASLERWLELLKLGEYYVRLCDEGYDTIDKVCDLTWEDLEEIGITKLGHQKRLLLGIERLKRYEKLQEERQNDYSIYDVNPNHRVSLNRNSPDNRLSTLGRSTVRSGFFQTRSGANLDHRGLPIATVVPALKHVSNSLANLDISTHQVISSTDGTRTLSTKTNGFSNDRLVTADHNNISQSTLHGDLGQNSLKMSDLSTTIKRNPPPLPPVRTNSLKIPQDNGNTNYSSNSIYGNQYGVVGNNGGYSAPMTNAGSTSFLRTPTLRTLTATTNKIMNTLGGHIQSIDGQPTTIRSIVPVREAPLPPVPAVPPTIPEKIYEEQSPMTLHGLKNPINTGENNELLMNQSSIRHQLASADEFPPPPPSQ